MAMGANEKMGEYGKNFDLLMNAAGEVMIAFKATSVKPDKPIFIYDGRNKGILYKTSQDVIPFYPIPKEAWESMGRKKEILCVEVLNNQIVAQYNAQLEVKR